MNNTHARVLWACACIVLSFDLKAGPSLQTCDEAGLDAAIAAGGSHTFDCVAPTTVTTTDTKVLSSPASVTLNGGDLLTISGNNAHRVFVVNGGATLRVENLTVTEGFTATGDGGAFINTGTLEIVDSTISNSVAADGSGGAISNAGGGEADGVLLISGSTITGNMADAGGGGLITALGTVDITDSVFSDNTALSSGGGIYTFGAITISGTTFSANSGTSGGGVFHDGGGTVAISNSTFIENEATFSGNFGGGGLYAFNGGTVDLDDTDFIDNISPWDGGGAVILNLPTTIDGGSFSGNSAVRWGGGLYNNQTGLMTITSVDFMGNEAQDGGGLYNRDTDTNIISSNFEGNTASASGGALYVYIQTTTITDTSFSENGAHLGGAIFNYGETLLSGSTFTMNSTTSNGGAIYNNDASIGLEISDSTFLQNSANNGGAILNEFGVNDGAWIADSTLQGNTANLDGGGIYNGASGPQFSVANVTFSGNSANRNGGAVLNRWTMTISYTTFYGNSAANESGGIHTFFTSAIDPTNSEISNSVFAANTNGDCGGNGTYTPFNNFGLGACGSTTVTGLSPTLQDNGGETETHALLADGNAIDTAMGDCPAADQRGVARPVDGNGDMNADCDAGAFEFEPQAGALPIISSFGGSPNPVLAGTAVTLSWTTTDADGCWGSWSANPLTANDSEMVVVDSTTQYTITCANAVDSVEAMDTVVVIDPPVITSFDADSNPVAPGGQTTLSWTTTNADSCTGSWTIALLPANGADDVAVDATTEYTINCINAASFDEAMVTVEVIDLPVVTSFAADPDPVALFGDMTTLSWTSTNADSCSGSWTLDVLTANGSDMVVVNSPPFYTIICENAVGADGQSLTVTVEELIKIDGFESGGGPGER